MTEIHTAPVSPRILPAATVPDTRVLITEQQVLLGTAAAAGVALPRPHERRQHWLLHAVTAVFVRPRAASRPPRHELLYLENARMAREMWRL